MAEHLYFARLEFYDLTMKINHLFIYLEVSIQELIFNLMQILGRT
jgi:hypothetical protein